MLDLVENPSLDLESQQMLLREGAPSDAQVEPEAAASQVETARFATQMDLWRIILLVSSAERFIWGASTGVDLSSDSYSAICNADDDGQDIQLLHDDEGEKSVGEEPLDGGLSSSGPCAFQAEKDTGTEGALETSGGVSAVAPGELIKTDLQQTNVSIISHSFLRSWNNCTIFLLTIAAVLSLAFRIKEQGVATGWIDGTIVTFTILVLVISNTIRGYFEVKSCHMKWTTHWLSRSKVQVIRDGNQLVTPASDLIVGDSVFLRRGCMVPADGKCEPGVHLEVDGEFKLEMDEASGNPILCYGSKVVSGEAWMRVTSVGTDTVLGEMMSQAINSPYKKSKFEDCLNKANAFVQIVGLFIAILISIALFIHYKLGKSSSNIDGYKADPKGEPTHVTKIMEIISGIISGSRSGTTTRVVSLLSISLVGVVEGIPIVASLAALRLTRKTLKHKALERDYLPCLKMPSLTTIIWTDKLGGLTEYEYEVDLFLVGEQHSVSESSEVAPKVLEGLCDGIRTFMQPIPSSSFESRVEPLILWAKSKIGLREGSPSDEWKSITGNNPFQECCGVVMEKDELDGRKLLYSHWKGPPQDILPLCSHYHNDKGEIVEIDDAGKRRMLEHVIGHNPTGGEDVIAFAYKTINNYSDELNGELILLGMIGLKHRNSEQTKRSILTLKEGGIRTILATGDNVQPADKIFGMLSPNPDDLVISAETFRYRNDDGVKAPIGNISIIWNCHLSDKIDLLRCLKEEGEVVAVVGQRTLDAPLLKRADIGITLGNWSSEIAREISNIHIWDADLPDGVFDFLVDVISKARCFHENICRNFIPITLIIGISSSLINIIGAVFFGEAPLTVIQLVLLNLLVALVGGFVVMTEPCTRISSCVLLVTMTMWRSIAIQVSYQVTVFVTLQSKGQAILGISAASIRSLICKGFCYCQVFSMFIGREPEAWNIFRGLFQKNGMYLFAVILLFILLTAFFELESAVSGGPRLSWKLVIVCLLIGVVSWFVDFVGKCGSSFIAMWAAYF